MVLTPEQEKWLRTNRNLAGMRGPAPSTQTDSDDDDDDGYDDGGGLLAKGPDGPGGLPDIGWALAGGKRGPTAAAKSALLKKLLEKGIKAQDSPHSYIAPNVSTKTGCSTSISANRSTRGRKRCSGMFGMSS